jgi:hypothetical protein
MMDDDHGLSLSLKLSNDATMVSYKKLETTINRSSVVLRSRFSRQQEIAQSQPSSTSCQYDELVDIHEKAAGMCNTMHCSCGFEQERERERQGHTQREIWTNDM